MKKVSIMILIVSILIINPAAAFAHEMYYDVSSYPNPPYPAYNLSWYYRTASNQAYLKVNQDLLVETAYLKRANVDAARWRWYTYSSRVSMVSSSFMNATVCVATPSEQYWEDKVGIENIYDYIAFTQIANIYGTFINGSNISFSNRSIKFSAIYVNPYDSVWDDFTGPKRIAIIAHELGHSLTLGHSNPYYYPAPIPVNDASIMKWHPDDIAGIPVAHDIADLQAKYPAA